MRKWQIIHIDQCKSTNSYLKELIKNRKITDKTAILTDFQEEGKGQGTNKWHSKRGLNLLGSFYRETEIYAEEHFILTVIVSLSLIDLLSFYNLKATIKWPNDIYIQNNKIAGILIENSVMKDQISNTILGVGLNVNQTDFPDWIPNPTSIQQHKKNIPDIKILALKLTEGLDKYFDMYLKGKSTELFQKYRQMLFQLNKWAMYHANNQNFNGQIHGIKPNGKLIVETVGGQVLDFNFGEISFIL